MGLGPRPCAAPGPAANRRRSPRDGTGCLLARRFGGGPRARAPVSFRGGELGSGSRRRCRRLSAGGSRLLRGTRADQVYHFMTSDPTRELAAEIRRRGLAAPARLLLD